jgi:ATP-binding cassette subfamily B protein
MHLPLTAHRRLLGAYLRPLWPRMVLLTLLILAGIALQLLSPQIIGYFLDATQTGAATPVLVAAALLFMTVSMARHGVTLATVAVSLDVGWQATNALRSDLLHHVLRLDLAFHKTHTPGELVERVDGDVVALGAFFAEFLVRVVANLLLIGGILLLVARTNALAGAALLLYAGVTGLALFLVQRIGATRWHVARAAWADQMGFIEEHYAGAEDLRGVGAEPFVLHRLYGLMRRLTETARAGWMAQALAGSLTSALHVIGYGLGLALGAWLYTRGEITIGAAFLLVAYVGMLAAPLDALRGQGDILQQATAGAQRVNRLFDLQSPVVDQPPAVAATPVLPLGPLALDCAQVSFAYDDHGTALPAVDGEHAAAPRTLHDITLHLDAGRVLGVLGRTGSGKSTLTRLLCRLYDPSAGSITLGSVDLRTVALPDLRRRVGVVTQDVQLFQATLRDNITFFDPTTSDAAVWAALAELGLQEWVAALPAGLDTRLAAGGQGFSAGEAQLLAFARLLLRDPGLVILDEAAARLDPITERRLEAAIDRLLHNRTAVIVAHRLHTVQRADDILILDAGRIVEYGPRAQLAAEPTSRFARLLRTGLEEVLA